MSTALGSHLAAAAIALAVGAGAASWWLYPQTVEARTRADQLATDLTAQQDAVEALREAGEKRAKEARDALAAARISARQHQVAAQGILTRALPAGADPCTAAAALIREELAR